MSQRHDAAGALWAWVAQQPPGDYPLLYAITTRELWEIDYGLRMREFAVFGKAARVAFDGAPRQVMGRTVQFAIMNREVYV